MRKKITLLAIISLFLTACARNPASYLPTGTTPIVNVESPLSEWVEVMAKSSLLTVKNQTSQPLTLQYKLFWYDRDGVTQITDFSENKPWNYLGLLPKSKADISLLAPTKESVNYRVYLRDGR